MFENLDLKDLVTPVEVNTLENLLTAANYDKVKSKFLIEGFRQGLALVIMAIGKYREGLQI